MNNHLKIGVSDRQKNRIFSLSVFLVFVVMMGIFTSLSSNFLTLSNVYNVLLNGSPLILITMGITFALLTGTMDMSVAAVAYMTGCVFSILLQLAGWNIILAILAALLGAVLLGFINSLLITRGNMNALIVTLGMMMVIRGIGKIVTQDRLILMGPEVTAIRQSRIEFLGGFPTILISVILIIAACQIVLKYTGFGRQLIAVGCNEVAARNIGVSVRGIKAASLLLSAGVSGMGGILWVITLGSVIPRGLNSYEFLAVASAVLGGTSLFGGRGSFFPGSTLGVLIYLFISNGLSVVGTSPFVIPLIRGAIIFLAMYADSLRTGERNN